jgi:hypothetical protein
MTFPLPDGLTGVRPWRLLQVCLLASAFTLLNALKPLHNDDSAYFTFAAEFARHPLNPYDFDLTSPYADPAQDVLVPPVLPYWWALGLRLLGDEPFLWKLWLWPFALLLAGALAVLYRRFAPGLEMPLLGLTLFSPAVLPGFNCMLEVPVLGLGLAALAVALRACDLGSWRLTACAGLLAGLALQTKYTALAPLAALVLWYVQQGRARQGLLAAALALLVFVCWEVFVACRHGQSHFLIHVGQRRGGMLQKSLQLLLPLMSLVGGLAPAVALLGLTALGASRRRVAGAAVAVALGFLALAVVPESWATFLQDPQTHKPRLTLANVVYGSLGLLAWGTAAAVAHRLCRAAGPAGPPASSRSRADRFLVCWLGLEVAGYFALSPYPAARRVVGIVLVLTLLAGRLASRTCQAPSRRALVGGVACAGVLLGLFVFGVDWRDARAAQQAAELAARRHRPSGPGQTTWHLSWGGFQFHAGRAGLKPLALNRSRPQPGDVIVVPDDPELFAGLQARVGKRLELLETLTVGDQFPLCTVPGYYIGRTPLEHHEGPRVTVRVYGVGTEGGSSAAR